MITANQIVKQQYDELIQFARQNPHDGYTERHHIIPRSLGGSNEKSNIVRLRARDHFRAHQLLVEMFETGIERKKMVFALHKMAYGTNKEKYEISSDEYEQIRILNAKECSKRQKERFKDDTQHQKQIEYAYQASLTRAKQVAEDPEIAKLASDNAKRITKQLIESGQHNFLGGVIQKEMWTRKEYRDRQHELSVSRTKNGTHPFQNKEFIERQKQRRRKRAILRNLAVRLETLFCTKFESITCGVI